MAKQISKAQTASATKIAAKSIKSTPKSAKKPNGKPNGKTNGKAIAPDSYSEVRKLLDKPLSEVPNMAIGRGGAIVAPRRFHLLPTDIEKMRKEYAETKQIPNPFNRGMYGYFFLSLLKLGANKQHPFKSVKEQMRQLASAPTTKDDDGKTDWQRFIGKEAATENEETALNVDGRLQQNAYVLQRLGGMTPYGLKLLQVGQQVLKSKGCVIDILKGKDGKEKCYRLNLNSADPINEFVRRRK
jgi:hypothetical protein